MSVAEELRQIVPGLRVSDAPADRIVYGRDMWPRDLIRIRAHDGARPGPRVIAWPESDEQVGRIVTFARETGTPIVPFGAGSGVCGAIAPSERTIVIDLKRFADYRLHPEQSMVEVGAGMLGITFENELGAHGFTVGHFPSSILCSTVGGWLAARGAGQCSGRYGKIEDMVVGADVVLGNAERVPMHWRAHGPNLAPLMVGSEGTLGVITRARLRLHRAPEARAFSSYSFSSVEDGWEALRVIYQAGLRPAVARLYDALDTALASKSHGGAPRDPSLVLRTALRIPRAINRAVRALEGRLLQDCRLILIFEGDAELAEQDSASAQRICSTHGASSLGEAPARAWLEHRYSVSYRQSPIFRAGAFSDTMEVAAPWSKLKAVYEDVRRALGRYVVVLAHLSHAYPDGCSIYFTFSARASSDARALALYDELWPAALQAAIGAGATLSHHHGVGRNKAPFMRAELGHGVELMRALKRAWDPENILNPGVLLPDSADKAPMEPVRPLASLPPCALDTRSLLADLDASLTIDECENLLMRQGYSLRIQRQGSETLAEWLALGMPGVRNPWDDPVDHVLVGLSARMPQGQGFTLVPAPRRAVGPDLSTLFVGERRIGAVARVTLRVHPLSSTTSRALPGSIESHDGLENAEAAAWESAIKSLLD